MLGAIGERLRGARYVASDVLFAVGRLPRAVGRGAGAFWASLPVVARRRLGAALGAAALVLVLASLVVPNLPCALPGGDECPPDDDAIELIPADALAYVHVNLDPETEQYEAAAEVAARTPQVSAQVLGSLLPLVIGGGGVPSDYAAEVAPWSGGELALAFTGARGRAQQVQLIEVEDAEGASAYVDSIAAGAPERSKHRDVEVSEDDRGLATAQVDGFLVLGPIAGVREVVDVATGAEGAAPLAGDETAADALDALPAQRIAEAYLSRDGLADLVADPESPLAALGALLDAGASRGAAVGLGASGDGLELATRSLLDPERAEARPGFFAAFDEFEPELPGRLASDVLAYVGLGRPSETAAALLRQATARAPGIARGFTDLVEGLQRDAGVNLESDLIPALEGEAAIAVVPRPAGADVPQGASLPGQVPPETVAPGEALAPYLELLASDVDEERVLEALARLQGPLARELGGALGAPVFDQQRIDDVQVQTLRLSPTAVLTYAVFDSMLAMASDPAGVRRAIEGEDDPLADSERYQRATDGLADEPALIAYLDGTELRRYGERSGLAEDAAYARFAPDLRRLEALALTVETEDDELRADARLLVGAE